MDMNRVNALVRAVTGIAILAGLALVIWELQRNREATMSQLTSEGYFCAGQEEAPALGDEPAEVLAKACLSSEELASPDLYRFQSYYALRNLYLQHLLMLAERGSFYEQNYRQSYGEFQFGLSFSKPAGRNYWEVFGNNWRAEIKDYGDSLLARAGEPDCADRYRARQALN